MKEIWRKIKGFPNHRVSNKGRIKNIKLKRILKPGRMGPHTKLLCIYLEYKGLRKMFSVHKLVAKTFKRMTKHDETAIHINYVQFDNRAPNLEGATRGEAITRTRKNNRLKKNKILGVYKWPYFSKKLNKQVTKWRAVLSLSDGQMKSKTIGYFKTRKEAKVVLHKAYVEKFGQEPFKL